MNTGLTIAWRCIGSIVATLLGVTFFFAIIGVFGLPASIAALVLFVALAVSILRRHQDEATRP
jgi:hypothetical protein